MAKIQTAWALGQRATPSGCQAGDVKTVELTYTVAAGATHTAADVVELGFLPAFHQVVSAVLVSDALGVGVAANVGFITGDEGSEVVGTELYSAADVSAATALTLNSAFALRMPSVDYNRPLGLKLSANVVAAGPAEAVTLVLVYAPSSN